MSRLPTHRSPSVGETRLARDASEHRGFWRRAVAILPEGRAIAEEVWQRRHRAMVAILWLHVVGIGVYAMVLGRGWRHSLFEASIVAAAGVACKLGPANRRFQSVIATLGLASASSILVHLSGGFIELHFHYFAALAVVSLYHDWAPFLTAIGFVVVQHGVVGVLDPRAVYNHPSAIAHPWQWAGIHAFFVLAASAVSLVRWKSSEVEALRDPLTSLPNRALFGDRLRQAVTRRRAAEAPMAVLFLDVDDFKSINDTAGHDAGDRLLIVVADRLRNVVRPSDTVARLGGDEFAIVLEDVADEAAAVVVARRINEAICAPLTFDGRRLIVSASIGVAVCARGELDADELLRNADIAMYVAKRGGKGRHAVFEPSMHAAVRERNDLAKDLEVSLERGEMTLDYQPVITLATGGIAGFEALIRWQHPRFGALPPARFIALAEETGSIVSLGRWVLRTACRQLRAWETQFPSPVARVMTVNVSPVQLADAAFVDEVSHALATAGIPAERLVLEVTEGSLVGESAAMIQSLHRLKSIGVAIALDDFGTGYSSLGYLRTLPIDILKIDKSFVDGVDGAPEDAALARAIIKIAESMGLRCIAEGVEREEQAQRLREAGCPLAQGFLFSRPVESSRIEAMLHWQPKAPERRGTILIVDREPAIRQMLSQRLRDAGFLTMEAKGGTEALRIMVAAQVDLVAADEWACDERGMWLGDRIKADPSMSWVPILAMPDAASMRRPASGECTADAQLQKPFGADELISNVRSLLDAPSRRGMTA